MAESTEAEQNEEMQEELELDDPNFRSKLIRSIRALFIEEGGLSINLESPIPVDLHALSGKELLNLYDNMVIEATRRKKDGLIERFMATIGATMDNVASISGFSSSSGFHSALEKDRIFRECLTQLTFGKGFSPPPWGVALLCGAFYANKVLRDYLSANSKSIGVNNGTRGVSLANANPSESGSSTTVRPISEQTRQNTGSNSTSS